MISSDDIIICMKLRHVICRQRFFHVQYFLVFCRSSQNLFGLMKYVIYFYYMWWILMSSIKLLLEKSDR